MTIEEYFELDRKSTDVRYEYIDGYVRLLAGETLDHATVSFNIARTLHALLRESPCRVYNSDVKVRLPGNRVVYPDVTVTCGQQEDGQSDILLAPCVIVEVLSPSTEDFDRGRKFTYYRQLPTIQEYVLIDPQHPSVEVFRRERRNLWMLYIFSLEDELYLTSLNVHFPVAALYEDVTLSSEE
ncbi:MAG TPA: Uma2 family endonuclease [Ktedonobacteraceae bacterium]|jgi:Uma2 family endonuclease|nr:Uma2 family endonuclease [Ktedonobacteraceae bacterium]